MQKKRGKVLFFYTHKSTFVAGDVDILSQKYDVREYRVKNTPKHLLLFSLIGQLLFLLFCGHRYDLIFIWFADYHSFLPALYSKIAGKPLYMVIGGYDVSRDKKSGYGSFTNPIRGFMALKSIKWATLNLCVSQYIERVVKAIAPHSAREVVYNGTDIYKREGANRAEDDDNIIRTGVLCVSVITNRQNYNTKGIDRYINLAQLSEGIDFTLIGADRDVVEQIYGSLPPNLTIFPRMEHGKLIEFYKNCKVYCQFSRRESFCLSLVEAMYFNMVPLISEAGGMPEVTNNLGFTIKDFSDQSLKSMFEKAYTAQNSNIYSQRVIDNFTIEIRKTALLNLL